MGDAEIKDKSCVLLGCENKAVAFCNNCRIPICTVHGKRFNQFYLCINCFDFTKRLRERSRL